MADEPKNPTDRERLDRARRERIAEAIRPKGMGGPGQGTPTDTSEGKTRDDAYRALRFGQVEPTEESENERVRKLSENVAQAFKPDWILGKQPSRSNAAGDKFWSFLRTVHWLATTEPKEFDRLQRLRETALPVITGDHREPAKKKDDQSEQSGHHPITKSLGGIAAFMAIVVDFGVMIFMEAAPKWFVGLTMLLSVVVILIIGLQHFLTSRFGARAFWIPFVASLLVWTAAVVTGFIVFQKPDKPLEPPVVFRRL